MERSVHSKTRFDVHRAVTDKIVEAIEAGASGYVMPWHRSGAAVGRPINAATSSKYRGVNVIALWAAAQVEGYGSGYWATFRQWQKLGASVRKGEHGTTIVFYKRFEAELEGEAEEHTGARVVARASRVFNAEQVSGWSDVPVGLRPIVELLPEIEAVVAAAKAVVVAGGSQAFYDFVHDRIHMPERARFVGSATSTATESYYAVLLHELTHWTGAGHRLNRTFGERFGDEAYAFEELVAELGAAFLCGDLGIGNDPRSDHAAYLASWLWVLKGDARAIFTASRLGSAAADYITGLSVPF